MSINLQNIKDVNTIYLAAYASRINIHSINGLLEFIDLYAFLFDLLT
jgi:hypothetical protein